MATEDRSDSKAERRVGAGAVALAGAVLTALTVASWLNKAEIIGGETSMQPGWFLLILLTVGSVYLLLKGIRDLLKA